MSEPSCLAGLIESGIGASRTPPMREGGEQGLRRAYQTTGLDMPKLGVEALPDLLLAAQRLRYAGQNITRPCRQAILPLLDELSPDAQRLLRRFAELGDDIKA